MCDILIEAKRLLETKGWTQNAYGVPIDPDAENLEYTCFCLFGAVDYAASSLSYGRWNEAWEAIRTATGENVSPISWNDHPNRTKAEVIAVLDQAIAACTPSS